jgi:hypothetical protein
MREPRCLAKSCQTRRNMQPRVTPLANVTTMAGAILPAIRRNMTIFCRYCVASCSLRVTKLLKLRLVSPKKSSMSQPRLKRQQTPIHLNCCANISAGACIFKTCIFNTLMNVLSDLSNYCDNNHINFWSIGKNRQAKSQNCLFLPAFLSTMRL